MLDAASLNSGLLACHSEDWRQKITTKWLKGIPFIRFCGCGCVILQLGLWLLYGSLRVMKPQPRFKVCNIYLVSVTMAHFALFNCLTQKPVSYEYCLYVPRETIMKKTT
jgi:hypothetical protein